MKAVVPAFSQDFTTLPINCYQLCQDENLWTPLHWAAEGANGEVIRALLSLGADRSIKNNDGNTAEDIANAKDDDRPDTIDTRSAFTS